MFHTSLARLRSSRRSLRIHLHWVPGHEGIEGGERADEEAKRAAQGESTPLFRPPRGLTTQLPCSSAALGAEAKQQTTRNWTKSWRSSPRARKLKAIGFQAPTQRIRTLYANRSRVECAILTQLRTGHVPLNAFLHRIHWTNSPLCDHCLVPETVEHFLLNCRHFATQRTRLKTAHRSSWISLCLVLSPGKKVGALLEYLRATRRFPDIKTPVAV